MFRSTKNNLEDMFSEKWERLELEKLQVRGAGNGKLQVRGVGNGNKDIGHEHWVRISHRSGRLEFYCSSRYMKLIQLNRWAKVFVYKL